MGQIRAAGGLYVVVRSLEQAKDAVAQAMGGEVCKSLLV